MNQLHRGRHTVIAESRVSPVGGRVHGGSRPEEDNDIQVQYANIANRLKRY